MSEVENNFVLITYIFSFLSVIRLSHLFRFTFLLFHSQLNLNLPFWFNHLIFLFSISLICIILHYLTVCVWRIQCYLGNNEINQMPSNIMYLIVYEYYTIAKLRFIDVNFKICVKCAELLIGCIFIRDGNKLTPYRFSVVSECRSKIFYSCLQPHSQYL